MAVLAGAEAAISRRRLWLEFAALYLGAPLVMALALPGRLLFPALALVSAAGLVLLWRDGFDWRGLARGWSRLPWGGIAAIAAVSFLAGAAILWIYRPGALFSLLRERPGFVALIWVVYPILSALPQELIFRPLFFHRYGTLLPEGRGAVAANAAIFSFAHLMYWSWIVAALTLAGGWIFARAYLRHGFPAAWVLHAVAGNVLFATGMGAYFYSGNVVRPF